MTTPLIYPSDLILRAKLGSEELTLRPFTFDQVEAYADLLEESRIKNSAFTMHSFYAAYEPLKRENKIVALKRHAEQLVTNWDCRIFPFLVWKGEELVGFQLLTLIAGGMKTDSFVSAKWQGRGYGTLMRSAVLTYGFEKLDQKQAFTSFVDPNRASETVSTKLGYKHRALTPYFWDGILWQRVDLTLDRYNFMPPHGFELAIINSDHK